MKLLIFEHSASSRLGGPLRPSLASQENQHFFMVLSQILGDCFLAPDFETKRNLEPDVIYQSGAVLSCSFPSEFYFALSGGSWYS